MTGDDLTRAAADFNLHMRAGALCSVAEPHRDADEDWPCSGCLLRSASQRSIPSTDVSTPASALSSETPRPLAEGVDGAVGRDRRLAAAPPSDSSPPRVSDTRGGGTGHRYGPQGA